MILKLNELQQVEIIFKKGFISKNIGEDLKLLSRYYYHYLHKTKKEIYDLLDQFMQRNYEGYKIINWHDTFEKYIKYVDQYPLCLIDHIDITQHEMDNLRTIKNEKLEKLAFTFLVLAKLNNQFFNQHSNWVLIKNNKDIIKIFKMARVNVRKKERSLMINDLLNLGLIQLANRVANLNIKVDFINSMSSTVLKIMDLRELGYEYLQYKGQKFYRCEKCGKLCRYKKNAKYCSECSKYQPIETKTKICVDCGVEFETSNTDNSSIRCKDCYKEYRQEYQKKYQKEYYKNKK